jgi:hypothetical protein
MVSAPTNPVRATASAFGWTLLGRRRDLDRDGSGQAVGAGYAVADDAGRRTLGQFQKAVAGFPPSKPAGHQEPPRGPNGDLAHQEMLAHGGCLMVIA